MVLKTKAKQFKRNLKKAFRLKLFPQILSNDTWFK